jgi:N-acetylmuramic acid 6-phosphate etherase
MKHSAQTHSEALLQQLDSFISEGRNPNTTDIDTLSSFDILQRINREDAVIAGAIEQQLETIAAAVDAIVDRLKTGGRLIYMGAGTSGRLGILDAVECKPTFSVNESMVQGIIAGGETAIQHAVEGAEDDSDAAIVDLQQRQLTATDVLVGLSASGRTPYVIAGLHYANSLGCATIAITCNPHTEVLQLAQFGICPIVGPEVLTGSTRMKSGTAQKMVLNMLSTAVMIRLGKSYQNLMVDVHASNEKLFARAIRIVTQATGCSTAVAEQQLQRAGYHAKLAILMILTGAEVEQARQLLQHHDGFLRHAVAAQTGTSYD